MSWRCGPLDETDRQAVPHRANRATRFSKDKRPYRTDISAVLPCQGGPKHAVAGFFVSIGPDHLERVPAGFPVEGPAAGVARYKQLYFRTRINPSIATSANLVAELSRRFRSWSAASGAANA